MAAAYLRKPPAGLCRTLRRNFDFFRKLLIKNQLNWLSIGTVYMDDRVFRDYHAFYCETGDEKRTLKRRRVTLAKKLLANDRSG